jgi:hypothetical protein
MQSKDHVAQELLWQNLSGVKLKNGVYDINFKGFMVENDHAN